MLLRARMRDILACGAVATGLFLLATVTVAVYIGIAVPTSGFGAAFNFAEPAVLTMNWTQASVPLATAVTLVTLAVWIGLAGLLRRWHAGVPFAALAAAFGVGVAAVSLVALVQMTSHVSRTGNSNTQAANALTDAGKLRPGNRVAFTSSLAWTLWVPQVFEVSWTELEPFDPRLQSPPPGTAVVEAGWAAGQPGPGELAAGPGGLADRRLRPGPAGSSGARAEPRARGIGPRPRGIGPRPRGIGPRARGGSDVRPQTADIRHFGTARTRT